MLPLSLPGLGDRRHFLGIFFLARLEKASGRQLQRDTGVGSYQTAWTLLHKLRSSLAPHPTVRLRERSKRMRPTSAATARDDRRPHVVRPCIGPAR